MKRIAVPLVGIMVALIALFAWQSVFADSPDPVGPAGLPVTTVITSQTCTTSIPCDKPGGGTATSGFLVSLNGGWYWGTHGTNDCNTDRAGIGYSADWFDPNDAGFSLGASATVFGASTPIFVGSLGTGSRNPVDNVVHPVNGQLANGTNAVPHDVTDPTLFANWRGGCGHYDTALASSPRSHGTWGQIFTGSAYTSANISHLYAQRSDFTKFCVVTYDVHAGKNVDDGIAANGAGGVPKSGDIAAGGSTHNTDNDVQKNVGAPFSSACIQLFSPTLPTVATGSTFQPNATTAPISDVVTLSGANPLATGTITINAYGPQTGTPYVCNSGNLVGTVLVSLSGANVNHAYPSVTINVTKAGDYVFTADYPGDAAHSTEAASSGCNDDPSHETATVGKATPGLTTDAGATVRLGATGNDLTDSATLTGATNGAVGPITFKLYGPDPTPTSNTGDDCTTQVGSDVTTALAIIGGTVNHGYTSPSVHITAAGLYHWIANFPLDTQNGATSNTCNGTGESVLVTDPKIDVSKTPPHQSVALNATATFTIEVTNIGDAASPLSGIVVTDAQASGCERDAAATLVLIKAKYGSTATSLLPGQSFKYDCSSSPVTVAFVNVVFACGNDPLGTQVCDTDKNGGDPPPGSGCDPAAELDRCAGVTPETLASKQDFMPKDTATVSGATNPNGNMTFALYKGTCTFSHLIYSDSVAVNASGTANTTSSLFLSALNLAKLGSSDTAGTYNWQISYDGDTNHNGDVHGDCGTENFVVTNG
jgi:hypothetical protein